MIELHQLTKEFRTKKQRILAVDRLSFEVKPGEIFGLLGPNGAGKTTTVRLLSTLIKPSSGTAFVNGYSIIESPQKVRASIGLSLGDERSFYYRLSGYENLEFFGTLQDIPRRQLRERITSLLRKMDLTDAKDLKFMKYSTGMKKKLSLCRALLIDPPVYFLDEPTSSLDPQTSLEIRESIVMLKKEGKTILLTTQNMYEAEKLCDRIAIINKGKLVVVSTTDELKQKLKNCMVQLLLEHDSSNFENLLKQRSFVERVTIQNGRCTITTKDKVKLLDFLFNNSNSVASSILDVKIFEPTLEDIFISFTKEGTP